MAYQPFYIAGLKSGLVQDPKAFLIPQDAFPVLENAYIFRDRCIRKNGYKLLGQLCRALTAITLADTTATGGSTTIADLLADSAINLRATEPNATIATGSVTLVVDPGGASETTLDEPAVPDGTLVVSAGPLSISSASINYATGEVIINWSPAIGGPFNIQITMRYCPQLPTMGIANRELTSINLEELIVFDTKYAYRWNNITFIFEEWIAGTTWQGSDSQFFWSVNYWQDDANNDLLWATNFNFTAPADPIRYSNGTTWTDFAPALGAEQEDDESIGTVTTPWLAFGPANVTRTPVIPKSVLVQVGVLGEEIVAQLEDDGAGILTSIVAGRADTGTINYTTGAITLAFNPALTADSVVHVEYQVPAGLLLQALAIVPYKDRLLAFNTFEGENVASGTAYPQRLRFSQNGDPTDQFTGWRSDVPGRGGFIDAPTNEQIVSVSFLRDIIVVGFERSTWQLRYTGQTILPFVWEKINTEYGSDATFSAVQFDGGVLQIGRDGLTSCNGNSVQRIDMQIPDQVGSFVSSNNGSKRVHGIRDLNIQLVYWTYNENSSNTFPNKLLVYNYANSSFSIWDDHFTVLGRWYRDTVLRWIDLNVPWESWDKAWNWSDRQANFPEVIGGNQQGYIEIFNQQTYNDVSLSISAITVAGVVTSVNHNLIPGKIVRLRSILGDTGNTDLNNQFFKIQDVTDDTFKLLTWDGTAFRDITAGSDYLGNGKIEVCNNFNIRSKMFNIYESGSRVMHGYTDFYVNRTFSGEFTCAIYTDATSSYSINTDPMLRGTDPTNFFNSVVPTSTAQNASPGADFNWQRFYCQTDASAIQFRFTFSDLQMIDQQIYESDVEIQALIVWLTGGGRLFP